MRIRVSASHAYHTGYVLRASITKEKPARPEKVGFSAFNGWCSKDLLTEFRNGTHEEAMVSRLGHW